MPGTNEERLIVAIETIVKGAGDLKSYVQELERLGKFDPKNIALTNDYIAKVFKTAGLSARGARELRGELTALGPAHSILAGKIDALTSATRGYDRAMQTVEASALSQSHMLRKLATAAGIHTGELHKMSSAAVEAKLAQAALASVSELTSRSESGAVKATGDFVVAQKAASASLRDRAVAEQAAGAAMASNVAITRTAALSQQAGAASSALQVKSSAALGTAQLVEASTSHKAAVAQVAHATQAFKTSAALVKQTSDTKSLNTELNRTISLTAALRIAGLPTTQPNVPVQETRRFDAPATNKLPGLSTPDFTKRADDFRAAGVQFQDALKSIDANATQLGRTLTLAVSVPIVAVTALFVKSAIEMETYRKQLIAVIQDEKKVASVIRELEDVAKLPGLSFQAAVTGFTKLNAAGVGIRPAVREIKAFGNAVATASSGPQGEAFAGVLFALTQIHSSTVLLTQDVRQIESKLPSFKLAMKAAFGTSDVEAIRGKGVTPDEFVRRVVIELEKMPAAGASTANSIENLKDSFFRLSVTIGGIMLPTVSKVVDGLGSLAEKARSLFARLPESGQQFLVVLALMAAAIGPTLVLFGSMAGGVANLAKVMTSFGAGATALAEKATLMGAAMVGLKATALSALASLRAMAVFLVTTPVGWAILAASVAAAAVAYALLNDKSKEAIATASQIGSEDVARLAAKSEQLRIAGVEAALLTGAEESLTAETEAYNNALNLLNPSQKAIVESFKNAEERAEQLRKALALLRLETAGGVVAQRASLTAGIAAAQAIKEQIEALNRVRDAEIESIKQRLDAGDTMETQQTMEGDVMVSLVDKQTRLIAARKKDATSLKEATESLEQNTVQLFANLEITGTSESEYLKLGSTLINSGYAVDKLTRALQQSAVQTGETTKKVENLAAANRQLAIDALKAGNTSPASEILDTAIKGVAGRTKTAAEMFREMAKAKKEAYSLPDGSKTTLGAIEAETEGVKARTAAYEKSRQPSSGGGGGASRAAEEAKAMAEAVRAIEKTEFERRQQVTRIGNARLLDLNEDLLQKKIIGQQEYMTVRARLEQEEIDLQIAAAQREKALFDKEATNRKLKPSERLSSLNSGTLEQLKINDLQNRRVGIETRLSRELREQLRLQRDSTDEIEKQLAALQGTKFEQQRESINEEANKGLEDLDKKIEAARRAGLDLKAPGLSGAFDLGAMTVQEGEAQQKKIIALRDVKLLEVDIGEAKHDIAQREIESALQLQTINDQAFQKAEDPIKTAQKKLALETHLKDQLAESVVILERFSAQMRAVGGDTQQLDNEIAELALRLETLGVKGLTQAFEEQLTLFERIKSDRDIEIEAIETVFGTQKEVNKVVVKYEEQLRRALAVLVSIAEASGNPELSKTVAKLTSDLDRTASAGEGAGQQIKEAFQESFISGFSNLVSDLTTNFVSLKEAGLNFARSMVAALSQVIAKLIAIKILESIGMGMGAKEGGIILSGGSDVITARGQRAAVASRPLSLAPGGAVVAVNVSNGEKVFLPRTVARHGKAYFDKLNTRSLPLSDALPLAAGYDIRGAGNANSDSISMFLPTGSYVLRASASSYYRDRLASLRPLRRAEGGSVLAESKPAETAQQTAQASGDVVIANLINKRDILNIMASPDGRKVVVNHISASPGVMRVAGGDH